MLFGYEWDLTNNWTFAVSILPMLLRGMVVTIQATLLGMGIALVLGLAFALLKMVPLRIVTWPVNFILEFVQHTAARAAVLPVLRAPGLRIVLPAFLTGAIALGISTAPTPPRCTARPVALKRAA